MSGTTVLKVNPGTMAAKNSAFVAFYADPTHLYRDNPGDEWTKQPAVWNLKVPLLGVISRYDGSFGFPGGQVEEGESLIYAAQRECEEEIGFWPLPEELTLICSHSMKNLRFEQNTHLFACKVTVDELYNLRKRACESEHNRIENAGFLVLQLHPKTVNNARMNFHWAGTAAQEVTILLDSGIIPACHLEE